jgi:hypothetical protein
MRIAFTQRRLQLPLTLPAQIGRAFTPPDPILHGTGRRPAVTNWAKTFDGLVHDDHQR